MTAEVEVRSIARSVRREVFVEASGGARVVRKEFLARTPIRRLREAIKAAMGRAASQREARALRAMEAAGVRAPRLVDECATGPGTRRLVQGFVAGDRLVDRLGDARSRRVVLPRIGAELCRVHRAGWVHRDLHEENVLVEGEEPTLIDWQRARKSAGRASDRLWDIARFEHSMWLRGVPLGDRLRFRRAALGLEPGDRSSAARARLRAVAPVIRERARRFATVRTRRAMRAEDGRARVELDGRCGLRVSALGEDELRTAIAAHVRLDRATKGRVTEPIGRFNERQGEVVLKRDHRAVITAVETGRGTVVVKEVRKAGFRRRAADLLRGSPARRAFRAGHGLLVRGVGTARPLAWLERRRFGVPVASWVVLEDLRGLRPVAEPPGERSAHVTREASGPTPEAVEHAVARLLMRLHAAGIVHGDLQALHVLLRPRVGATRGRVDALLIDCESVRFVGRLSDDVRIGELAALNASVPDTMLSLEARRRILESVARRVPFETPSGAVLRAVVEASVARRQSWRGRGCAFIDARPELGGGRADVQS